MPTVTTTAQEADRLERAMNALKPKLSIDQEIAIWDTWQDHGEAAAQHVLTAMKEARTPERLKATDIDQMLADVRSAYIAGDARAFAAALQRLAQLGQPVGTAGSRTTDTLPRAPVRPPVTKEVSAEALMDGARVAINQDKYRSL